jgi:hypothetical protein
VTRGEGLELAELVVQVGRRRADGRITRIDAVRNPDKLRRL